MSHDPLHIEIAHHIAEKIIRGEIPNGEILEAKVWSEQSGFNLGAVQRAFEHLQAIEVLKGEQRLATHADSQTKALSYRKERLLFRELQDTFTLCKLLGVSAQELKDSYSSYLEKHP